jgi:CxxC-x17-CxxC domain-containing protein
MAFQKRDNGYGARSGGKRFGGDRAMHSATCAQCGDQCQVPFRPNGRKPVLCSNCFGKDGGPKKSYREDRPSYSARPSYSDRGGDDVSQQLKAINSKLDAIIIALDAIEQST